MMNSINKLCLSGRLLGVSGLLALVAWVPVVQAANGATTVSVDGYEYADFLSDYSNLKPQSDAAESKAAAYRRQGADWADYDKVLLDEIQIHYEIEEPPASDKIVKDEDTDFGLQQNSGQPQVTAKDLESLKSYLRDAVTNELGKDFSLAAEPGQGVLRLRIAITELEPTMAGVSVAMAAIPFGSLADFAASGGTGQSAYLGTAAIEAEFVDSQSNEQMAAYVEKRAGTKYNIDLEEGIDSAIDKGISSYFSAYSRWAYVEDALDYWARALRASLDGVSPAEEPIKTVQRAAVRESFEH